MAATPILQIDNLSITFKTLSGPLPAVRNISFEVKQGECYALIGESGSGKSTVAFAAMGYLPANGSISSGEVRFMGEAITNYSHEELRRFRGSHFSMVFQNPHTAANPCYTIGNQLIETLAAHTDISAKEAYDRAVAMLEAVNIPSPHRIMKQYPHQVSGGQKQRVTIAQGLLCNPELIIMDEPTTALDVTTEIQFLRLLDELREKLNISLLYITHDMGIVARVADRIGVIYAGSMVEEGTRETIFGAAEHPYTQGLMKSIPPLSADAGAKTCSMPGMIPNLLSLPQGCVFAPRCPRPAESCATLPPMTALPAADDAGHRVACHFPGPLTEAEIDWQSAKAPIVEVPPVDPEEEYIPLLLVEDVHKHYDTTTFFSRITGSARPPVKAVNGVSFKLHAGETLGIVGESGCGKSTLANTITRTQPATAGRILYKGRDITHIPPQDRELSKSIQIIFQNPDSSLNPRHSIRTILGRPLVLHNLAEGEELERRCERLLDMVRLPKNYLNRKPHQLSGGEKQRVGIARAFAVRPDFVICDEVTSALDVSVQASIITLLRELQHEFNTAYLYISHDLATVRQISRQIGVMYLGKMMEIGSTEEVFRPPYHPYTRALLSSISLPVLKQPHTSILLQGSIPSPESPPPGCAFSTRCYQGMVDACSQCASPLNFESGHGIACHLPLETLREVPPL
ncbi:ABC transporter ATP-binding protein, partial [Desulfovibrio sp. OttesenSCG-928-I05]|nr:ABC transporter ATP-binding protein [Desulfovibrio sp. OttesenSCG-928-I05]